MKVLVTGASGYFGRTLVQILQTKARWTVLTPLREEFDLRYRLDHSFQVNYIIHAAARRYGTITECIDDNVIGTANLIEFAKKQNNLKSFIFISSSDVVGPGSDPRDEEATLSPTTPYAFTKAAAERLCECSGLPVTICRPVNIVCSESDPRKFPSICRQIIFSEKILTIYEGSRMYIHARDVAEAIIAVMDTPGKFNIVGKELSNRQVAEIVAKKLKKELFYEMKKGGSGHEPSYNLSGEKLFKKGWIIKTDVEEYI